MRGRQILIEPLASGGHAAALLVDGRLQDLLIDPPAAEETPRPEAIYRAVPSRPMKGLGGSIVDLGSGLTGFLRGGQGLDQDLVALHAGAPGRRPAAASSAMVSTSGSPTTLE